MFGRRKLPAALTPRLERDERVLAWGGLADGRVVVATNRGLWLPDVAGRVGWHRVHKATWNGDVLTVVGSSVTSPDRPDFAVAIDTEAISFTLVDPGDLPKRVRERVSASVAYSSRHQLPGGGAVRVVARRVSGRDGLSWSVRYEGCVEADDPAVLAATAELVAAARQSVAPAD